MSGDFPAHCLTCLVCSSGCIAPVVRFNHTTDGTIFLAGTVVAPASGGALVAAASGSVPAAVSASVQFTRASGNTPMTISVLVPAFAAPGVAALAISLDGGATFYSGPQAGLLLFEPLTVFPPAGPVGAVTSVTVAGTAFFDAGAAMVGRFGAAGDVPCKFKAGAVLCLGPLAEGTAVAWVSFFFFCLFCLVCLFGNTENLTLPKYFLSQKQQHDGPQDRCRRGLCEQRCCFFGWRARTLRVL
jgi:hypothetical protein